MNDRNRRGGSRDDRNPDHGEQQAGGWGGLQRPSRQGSAGQHEQWEDNRRLDRGGQQGGWQDDWDWSHGGQGEQDRPEQEWPRRSSGTAGGGGSGQWSDEAQGDARQGSRDWGQPRQGNERSWAERAWGGSSQREGDRGLGAAAGDGRNRWDEQDDRRRPGSQSFACGYGLSDGASTNSRAYAHGGNWHGGNWHGADWAGSSTPGYGRGYGPDYGRDHGGRDDGRGFLECAGDRIAAWFGDDDAQDRHDRDQRGESHRGLGPGEYTRSDERIREDVNDRLTDDHHVDARRISVTVAQSEVTLAGTVPDRGSKRRAEDVAERVSGVRHVQNNLRIDMQAGPSSGSSQYTGQPIGTATHSGGTLSEQGQVGLGGGGRPDASAASPAGGSQARADEPATGTSGGAATGGSSATGSSGSSATGAATGTTGGSSVTGGSGTGKSS